MVSISCYPGCSYDYEYIHYVRQYRYKTLLALKSPLDLELRLMDELAVNHLKTYQVWHHRRLLVTEMRKPAPELEFIAKSLKVDAKNYHTWSYRQWLLVYFNDDELWKGELDFVERMLTDDIRNNSAWHHRFFTVFQSGTRQGDEDRDEVLRRELAYVLRLISRLELTNRHIVMSKNASHRCPITHLRGTIYAVYSTTIMFHIQHYSFSSSLTQFPAPKTRQPLKYRSREPISIEWRPVALSGCC
jgi:hypothetical protein